ncbi:site-specific DNA-methyltransferase [Macrococcus hajekii]|uniref:Methyltransferase n=1 Tax=Macrococcus hajekii TaxID=198482 RepID=A0A4R6BIG0_9STAP|nr:site-specific DNA-methyltransferase [Macrococcus hajekii]TDM01419.1 site-specific DNA-methyltransferase [Macrococcus hajekii]GGA99818.1 hypothetical protein GCM10007190_04830 [Macrococcus hajekii]
MGEIELNKIYNEECLEGMKKIPEGSIDLIVCDPPYGTMKNSLKGAFKKRKDGTITQYSRREHLWDTIIPTEELFNEYARVLRDNGRIVLFSQEPYTSHLRSYKCGSIIQFNYPMIWKKNNAGNILGVKKAPVNYFEDISVWSKNYDYNNLSELRNYVRELKNFIGLNSSEINKKVGNYKFVHFLSPDGLQFKIVPEQTYNQLIEVFNIDKWKGFKPYEELKALNVRHPRIFNIPEGQKFASNVLEFNKKPGFHPTQKPVDLIEHLIKIYSHEGDTVLDNCMGSGTTAIACMNTNRNFIGFEMDETFYKKSIERINNHRVTGKQIDIFEV